MFQVPTINIFLNYNIVTKILKKKQTNYYVSFKYLISSKLKFQNMSIKYKEKLCICFMYSKFTT